MSDRGWDGGKVSWWHWIKERDIDVFAVLIGFLIALIWLFLTVKGGEL